jgi:hypothetical protein
MQNVPSQPAASAERRFRLVLWLWMLAAIPMYYAVMRAVPPGAPTAGPTLLYVLLPLSVVTAVLSISIRKLVARSKPRDAFILGLALCEAAALFGMVAWFVTGSPHSCYCLGAGAAGMLLHFPRAAQSAANPE